MRPSHVAATLAVVVALDQTALAQGPGWPQTDSDPTLRVATLPSLVMSPGSNIPVRGADIVSIRGAQLPAKTDDNGPWCSLRLRGELLLS